MIVVRRTPAHDLAIAVAFARVNRVQRHHIPARIAAHGSIVVQQCATAVVGQRTIGLDGDRVHGNPFGAIHGGGADGRGRHTGVNKDLDLGHAGCLRGQGNPLTAAVLVEAKGHEQVTVELAGALDGAAARLEAIRKNTEASKTLASVCPARVNTPPGWHINGKTCPG